MEQSDMNYRLVVVSLILLLIGYLVSVGYAEEMPAMLDAFLRIRNGSYIVALVLLGVLVIRRLTVRSQSRALPFLVVFIVGVTFSYAIAQVILNALPQRNYPIKQEVDAGAETTARAVTDESLVSIGGSRVVTPLSIQSWNTYSVKGLYTLRYPKTWKVDVDNRSKNPGERYGEWESILSGPEGNLVVGHTNDTYGGGCPDELRTTFIYGKKTFDLCGYKKAGSGTVYVGQRVLMHEKQEIIVYAGTTIHSEFAENLDIPVNILFSMQKVGE